jgi:hypothetical protein
MNLTTTAGEDMSDSLKYLTGNLAATFVYAGINVESEGLFTGVRGQQIMARCVMERTAKIPYSTEWRTTVKTMESAPAASSAACPTSSGPPQSWQSTTAAKRSPENS